MIVGGLIAAQAMVLSLAVSITPPASATGRLAADAALLAMVGIVTGALGVPLLRDAIAAAARRRLAMEQLFLIALSAALSLSIRSLLRGAGPVYFDIVAVLLVVYALGRALNGHYRQQAMRAADTLLVMATTARRVVDGPDEIIAADVIIAGDVVRVLPGEIVPIDGVVQRGNAFLRRTPFTGEWIATTAKPGDTVQAGGACEDGELLVRATTSGSNRQLDALATMIASACAASSPLQRQADRWTRRFLPIVTIVAMSTAAYWLGVRQDADAAMLNALSVLLVACPCAAGLATPLALWRAAAACAARGLVFRSGSDGVERLAGVTQVIFDKTGTLADERVRIVAATYEGGWSPATVRDLVAAAEEGIAHPVARALAELGDSTARRLALRVLPGAGIEAEVNSPAGHGVMRVRIVRALSDVAVTIDGKSAATFTLAESLRASAQRTIERLAIIGLPCSVLTGDTNASAAATLQLPLTPGMSPAAKHATVVGSDGVLFVGDGANDAAALAAAQLGVAMAIGSPAALAAAGAVLHGGDLTTLPWAIGRCRRAVAAARSNLRLATGYNLAGIALAASGHLHPVVAAILMCVSSSIVAWRASREPAAAVLPSVARPPSRLRSDAMTMPWPFSAAVGGQAVALGLLTGWSPLLAAGLGVAAFMFAWMAGRAARSGRCRHDSCSSAWRRSAGLEWRSARGRTRGFIRSSSHGRAARSILVGRAG